VAYMHQHVPESIWDIQLRTSARRISQYCEPSYRGRKFSIFLDQHISTKVGHRHCLRVELVEMRKATVSSRSMSKGFQQPGVEPSGASETSQIIPIFEEDPYNHIAYLGRGTFGVVDKVTISGRVYARKMIHVTTGRAQNTTLQVAQREFLVLNRLRHCHIVQVVRMFHCQDQLHIVMSQVADTDMKKYLEKADSVGDGTERNALRKSIQTWPGCLIQAIDYLHEMRVKHRDLKPANILVKGGEVLIADFGVSKDLIDEETTASMTGAQRVGSEMYWASEIDAPAESGPQRRGRAVDIYALGCIFLELATVLIAPPGSRARFTEFREIEGSTAYRMCPEKLVQWIWHLWGHWSDYGLANGKKKISLQRLHSPRTGSQ
jgi:serine/threonine protein kinase